MLIGSGATGPARSPSKEWRSAGVTPALVAAVLLGRVRHERRGGPALPRPRVPRFCGARWHRALRTARWRAWSHLRHAVGLSTVPRGEWQAGRLTSRYRPPFRNDVAGTRTSLSERT